MRVLHYHVLKNLLYCLLGCIIQVITFTQILSNEIEGLHFFYAAPLYLRGK